MLRLILPVPMGFQPKATQRCCRNTKVLNFYIDNNFYPLYDVRIQRKVRTVQCIICVFEELLFQCAWTPLWLSQPNLRHGLDQKSHRTKKKFILDRNVHKSNCERKSFNQILTPAPATQTACESRTFWRPVSGVLSFASRQLSLSILESLQIEAFAHAEKCTTDKSKCLYIKIFHHVFEVVSRFTTAQTSFAKVGSFTYKQMECTQWRAGSKDEILFFWRGVELEFIPSKHPSYEGHR